jgi:maleate cis-trans isomerase
MPIVRQKMIEFVNSGGITIAGSKGLYIKNNPTIIMQVPVLKPVPMPVSP